MCHSFFTSYSAHAQSHSTLEYNRAQTHTHTRADLIILHQLCLCVWGAAAARTRRHFVALTHTRAKHIVESTVYTLYVHAHVCVCVWLGPAVQPRVRGSMLCVAVSASVGAWTVRSVTCRPCRKAVAERSIGFTWPCVCLDDNHIPLSTCVAPVKVRKKQKLCAILAAFSCFVRSRVCFEHTNNREWWSWPRSMSKTRSVSDGIYLGNEKCEFKSAICDVKSMFVSVVWFASKMLGTNLFFKNSISRPHCHVNPHHTCPQLNILYVLINNLLYLHYLIGGYTERDNHIFVLTLLKNAEITCRVCVRIIIRVCIWCSWHINYRNIDSICVYNTALQRCVCFLSSVWTVCVNFRIDDHTHGAALWDYKQNKNPLKN